jgi:hypothetical protein
MVQERERSRASDSAISGKRFVRSFPRPGCRAFARWLKSYFAGLPKGLDPMPRRRLALGRSKRILRNSIRDFCDQFVKCLEDYAEVGSEPCSICKIED